MRRGVPDGIHVAVIIPSFNAARWLPGVLESVAAQTVAPADVLVVDDGSTDGSAELAARFDGVRVLALERNGGFARAANAGIAGGGAPGGGARPNPTGGPARLVPAPG